MSSETNEIENQINKNWQFIYDNAKGIQVDMKKTEVCTTADLEEKYKEFKGRFPKAWDSVINGTFSLIEFKKMKNTYSTVYKRKQGDHFDKKNLGNVALGSQLAKDYNVYNGKEPTTEAMQKAYEKVLEKNAIARKNNVKD